MSHDASHDASHDGCGGIPAQGDLGYTATGYEAANRPSTRGILVKHDSLTVAYHFHSACDLKLRFKELARAAGLVPIDMYWPNLTADDVVKLIIVDDDPWSPPDDEKPKPSGWYPGANGWTRLWREYWQIGKKPGLLRFWDPVSVDMSQRTFLDVSGVTWYFRETGDMQTRFRIDLKVLPEWNPREQCWIYDGPSFDQHKSKAQLIADGILRTLEAHPACQGSKLVREGTKR